MKKYRKAVQGVPFFTLALILSCMAFLGAAAWSFGVSSQGKKDFVSKEERKKLDGLRASLRAEDLRVTNKTQAFNLVGIEKTPDNQGILLSLRNDYDKRITAYQVSVGSNSTQADYAFSEFEDGILPGAILQVNEEISGNILKNQSVILDPDLETNGIAILAVMFEDGTSDGDSISVGEIEQFRLGARIPLDGAISMLEKARGLSEDLLLTELDRIKSDHRFSIAAREKDLSQQAKSGMKFAQSMILMMMENRSNNGRGGKDQITNLIERYKRIRSKAKSLH